MSFGRRIIELRTACGLSQYQLAKLLDVSRQAVSKWENDQAVPDTLKMIKLSDVLDTDIEYLATGRKRTTNDFPVVLSSTETAERIVEKPVVKCVETVVEKIVERPVIRYVEKPVVKKVYRKVYIRNPIEFLVCGITCAIIGLVLGLIF